MRQFADRQRPAPRRRAARRRTGSPGAVRPGRGRPGWSSRSAAAARAIASRSAARSLRRPTRPSRRRAPAAGTTGCPRPGPQGACARRRPSSASSRAAAPAAGPARPRRARSRGQARCRLDWPARPRPCGTCAWRRLTAGIFQPRAANRRSMASMIAGVFLHRPSEVVRHHLARQVIVGRPEAAGEHHDAMPRKGMRDVRRQLGAVVADDRLERDGNAKVVQHLGDEERVGVDLFRA